MVVIGTVNESTAGEILKGTWGNTVRAVLEGILSISAGTIFGEETGTFTEKLISLHSPVRSVKEVLLKTVKAPDHSTVAPDLHPC